MDKKYFTKEYGIDSTHILLKTDTRVNLEEFILKQRSVIQDEIYKNPLFNGYESVPINSTSRILELMTRASNITGIGPMSAVAGSISQVCLEYIEQFGTTYTILENGGDIALKTNKTVTLGVYAGDSTFTNSIGLKVKAKKDGYGICTSSGTVGPSKSFGQTDATIVFSPQASVSDSLATLIGNYGNGKTDEDIVNNALEKAEDYNEFFDGAIVIKGEYLAKVGKIPKIVTVE
ncbi:MAG: hypothetical protein BZ135_07005 [Methanosphaera sp. rholeuAM6]|nr:MAG: hypothetical protein BZ135_07005 [Methanosphaera sp. rholeuAM6]